MTTEQDRKDLYLGRLVRLMDVEVRASQEPGHPACFYWTLHRRGRYGHTSLTIEEVDANQAADAELAAIVDTKIVVVESLLDEVAPDSKKAAR